MLRTSCTKLKISALRLNAMTKHDSLMGLFVNFFEIPIQCLFDQARLKGHNIICGSDLHCDLSLKSHDILIELAQVILNHIAICMRFFDVNHII